MQCRFSFKHMGSSQPLIDYAEDKIRQKIEKYSTKPIEAHVTFMVEGHDHIAHCTVRGGDGFSVQVESSCADMYGSVDLLLDKLAVQLKKQKEKLKNHKFSQTSRIPPGSDFIPGEDKDKDCDSVPVDADDVIKLEKARVRVGS